MLQIMLRMYYYQLDTGRYTQKTEPYLPVSSQGNLVTTNMTG